MSQTNPSVHYWEINGKKRVRQKWVCFSGMGVCGRTIPQITQYPCPIDASLTDKEAAAWINHVYEMFGEPIDGSGLIKHKVYRARPGKTRRIAWQLKTDGMTKYQSLTYLTALRYPDEFAPTIKAWVKLGGKTPEDRFAALQQIHLNALDKGLGGFGWGHSLMYGKNPIISLETFQANARKGCATVYDHFRAPVVPKVVAPVVGAPPAPMAQPVPAPEVFWYVPPAPVVIAAPAPKAAVLKVAAPRAKPKPVRA